jgi:hypothetical protein
MSENDRDDELIAEIAPDVMRALTRRGFFEKLDDKLCPVAELSVEEQCGGNYSISESLLRSLEFDDEELSEIFSVFQLRGGFCDCEILYNVSETNRLKAKYWKRQAGNLSRPTDHRSPDEKPHQP